MRTATLQHSICRMTILCSSLLTNLSSMFYYCIYISKSLKWPNYSIQWIWLIMSYGSIITHFRRFKLGLSFINSHNLSNVISIFNQTQRSFTLYGLQNEQFSFWGQKLFFGARECNGVKVQNSFSVFVGFSDPLKLCFCSIASSLVE